LSLALTRSPAMAMTMFAMEMIALYNPQLTKQAEQRGHTAGVGS
jgi:hypothetical protein